MIKKCECGDFLGSSAKYQNKEYGYGFRVFNPCNNDRWRCTICEKEIIHRNVKINKEKFEE